MPAPDRNARLTELFARAVDLGPAERQAFIARECADDPELRTQLAVLLQVEGRGLGEFLARPAMALPAVKPSPVPCIPGYEDLEAIGEGGMGTVYRARQVSPVRRTVAIKAIRPGMDSRQVLARFDAERQALARMAHPYIATVHDAGSDDQGRPYLVMEFVDGQPISDYCSDRGLDLEQRVDLFIRVCDAVDHAHRRGVLHRDLKPSNVLVVHGDEQPLPKVIDFGIAKALEGSLGEQSIHTVHGSLLGTPEYMSPEQFDGDGRRIDTRTDIYALGAMLYELLTGERPFDTARMRAAGITELARIVRDELPLRPSKRLRKRAKTAVGEAPATLHLARRLQGDLDWVVMKALDKDPERRYATPRQFADDLRRFLRHEPVEAGPPSGIYRIHRFARRYRIQMAVATGIIAALTVGLFGTLWFLFEAKVSEAHARASAREAEGARIAATAALVTDENPNLALLLASEAFRLTSDFSVTETVYGALPQQNLAGRLLHSDYGTTQAVFLDDGRLLSCGVDPVFWLTDIDRGALLHRFVGHKDRVNAIAVSPSGRLVASGSDDATARIWDVASGSCLCLMVHPASVRSIAWAPDGSSVGTTCDDGVIRLFAAGSGALSLTIGDGDQSALAFDAAGDRLATRSASGDTLIWSTLGELLRSIPADPRRTQGALGSAAEIRFAADGSRLVLWERIQDLPERTDVYTEQGQRLASLDSCRPLRLEGDELLAAAAGGFLVLSLSTGAVLERIDFGEPCRLFAVAPDRRHAIGIAARRDCCVVDLEARRITHRLSGEREKNWQRAAAFHPDGERFVITGRELLIGRVRPDYAPFDLPVADSRTKVASLAAQHEALVLLNHRTDHAARWSLWSIDQQQKLRDLPIDGVDELQLVSDGTHLHGFRMLPAAPGRQAEAEVSTFDLDGRTRTRIVLPCSGPQNALRPEGGLYAFVDSGAKKRTAHVFDSTTGAVRFHVDHDGGWLTWGSGREARHLAVSFGARTRTDVLELATGALVASVRGPVGAGHYGVAIDAERSRLLLVLGDLRARVYDLHDTARGPIGEYTRIVRSNNYPCGFLPDGSMAWVMCSNELHVFHVETCEPFAALRLGADVQFTAARADSREIVTVLSDGRCQRWPIDAGAVARRLGQGALTERELDLYRIGSPAEREAREEQRLRDNPTARNHALLGESCLRRGDLDEAIACYRRCCGMGPLAPMDLRRYLRLLELLARRNSAGERPAADIAVDVSMAAETLREAVRCGVTRSELDALPGFAAFAQHDELHRLLPR